MSMSGVATAEPKQAARIALKAKGRRKRKRFIVAGLVMLAALGYLIYTAVASNSEYYLTVSEVYAMGEQAAALVVRLARGEAVSDTQVLLPTTLHLRATTAPPTPRPAREYCISG